MRPSLAGTLTSRSGAGRRLGAASGGRSRRGRRVPPLSVGIEDQCDRFRAPSSPPKRPDWRIARRNNSWLICLSDQRGSLVESPQIQAVRLAASVGVKPFISKSRYTGRVAGAVVPAACVLRLGLVRVGATPGPAAVTASARGNDEPGRDDRPCPRDPRGACPAMSHVSPACVAPGRSGPVRWAHVGGRRPARR